MIKCFRNLFSVPNTILLIPFALLSVVDSPLMFYLVTAGNVGKMMNYCSDKIDFKFQLGAAVPMLMLLLLYSSSFDVPRRFMADVEFRWSLISCLSRLFLTGRFFPRLPKEATDAFIRIRAAVQDFLMFTLISENDHCFSRQEHISFESEFRRKDML